MKKTVLAVFLLAPFSHLLYGQTNTFPSSGSVGIGTTTPEAKLTISQIGNGWNDGFRINRDASNYLTLTEDVTDIRLKNWGSGGIILFTSATEGLRILNNGNVGIGTSGPYAHSRLHVKSPSATPWGFMVEANANDKVMAMGHDGTTGYISTSYLASGGWSGIELRTQNTTRVNIASDGNVGIGTTSAPQAKLHISNGDVLLQNQTSGYPSLYLKDVAGTKVIKIDYNSVVGWGSKFYIRSGATGGNEALVLNDVGGNVGIGTANPSEKLTVNGTIYGTKVKVDLTVPGPDYVFEKDYKLPALQEIKSYIDTNKHLPEVPSAKEMEANGINVGEMNMLLLKKVEELTLYIIEQQKQINELQKAIKKD